MAGSTLHYPCQHSNVAETAVCTESCVGLEVRSRDCDRVTRLAAQAGALVSTSVQAAELFRFVGLGS